MSSYEQPSKLLTEFAIAERGEEMTKEALTLLVHEMEYVLSCINENKIPFDGDDFHEALRLGKEALSSPNGEAQPEQRSVSEQQEPVGFAVMQKPWVGLTDEEIEHIIVSVPFADEEDYEVVIRAAVAKLKEKNTRNGGCL